MKKIIITQMQLLLDQINEIKKESTYASDDYFKQNGNMTHRV